MKKPRILLADDHGLLLEAFSRLLSPAYDVVATVTDGRALVEATLKLQPDLVVADIGMPQLNGLDAVELLRSKLPNTRVIFLTVNEDPDMAAEAIRRGALGYLLKKSAATELFAAIREALAGRHYITPLVRHDPIKLFVSRAGHAHRKSDLTLRQREVLQLLAEGRSMKEAADILKVTPRTIAFHKYSMMAQLGFRTGAELVQHAVHLGLVARPEGAPPTC